MAVGEPKVDAMLQENAPKISKHEKLLQEILDKESKATLDEWRDFEQNIAPDFVRQQRGGGWKVLDSLDELVEGMLVLKVTRFLGGRIKIDKEGVFTKIEDSLYRGSGSEAKAVGYRTKVAGLHQLGRGAQMSLPFESKFMKHGASAEVRSLIFFK